MANQPAEGTAAPGVEPEIVALPAEIDIANARDVRSQLVSAVLTRGVAIVIADMTATTFLDSMGLRALLMANRQATETGNELRIVAPDPRVLRIIQITGTEHYLRLYQDMATALA